MTGTVPRSFIAPTILSPRARACARRSFSLSRKFQSRSAAAELSKRRWRRRRSRSFKTWRPSGPPYDRLLEAGPPELRIAGLPFVEGEFARSGAHEFIPETPRTLECALTGAMHHSAASLASRSSTGNPNASRKDCASARHRSQPTKCQSRMPRTLRAASRSLSHRYRRVLGRWKTSTQRSRQERVSNWSRSGSAWLCGVVLLPAEKPDRDCVRPLQSRSRPPGPRRLRWRPANPSARWAAGRRPAPGECHRLGRAAPPRPGSRVPSQ